MKIRLFFFVVKDVWYFHLLLFFLTTLSNFYSRRSLQSCWHPGRWPPVSFPEGVNWCFLRSQACWTQSLENPGSLSQVNNSQLQRSCCLWPRTHTAKGWHHTARSFRRQQTLNDAERNWINEPVSFNSAGLIYVFRSGANTAFWIQTQHSEHTGPKRSFSSEHLMGFSTSQHLMPWILRFSWWHVVTHFTGWASS